MDQPPPGLRLAGNGTAQGQGGHKKHKKRKNISAEVQGR
jgi:hypothetical protein